MCLFEKFFITFGLDDETFDLRYLIEKLLILYLLVTVKHTHLFTLPFKFGIQTFLKLFSGILLLFGLNR